MKKKIMIIIIVLSILILGIIAILFLKNRADSENLYAFIDKNGEQITSYKFGSVDHYRNNELVLVQNKAGKYGYTDYKGNYVIRPQFEAATPFENEYAYVTKTSFTLQGKKTEYGYIDKTGKIVIPGKAPYQSNFAVNGLAIVTLQQGTNGYVDKSGEYVIPPVYDEACEFADNGLAAVCKYEDGGIGYIDETGSYVIEPKFLAAGVFNENRLASVKDKNGLYGYIDEQGNYVIEPQFKYAGNFNEGIASVGVRI